MKCHVDNCGRTDLQDRTRKLCRMHYHRLRRTGSVGQAAPRQRPKRSPHCEYPGCTKPDKSAGLCSMHAARKARHGDPSIKIAPEDRKLLTGTDHPNWIGDQISYAGAHRRVRAAKGPASNYTCLHCHKPAEQWAYDNQDPDERTVGKQRFSVDLRRYIPLCVPCHSPFDKAARRAAQAPGGIPPGESTEDPRREAKFGSHTPGGTFEGVG